MGSSTPTILFWDVDTQADFIHPDGKLYVPGANTIVPNLKRLTECAGSNGILVIASACAHQEDDPEFAQYPPHCLVGTPGQQKIPETRLKNVLAIPNRNTNLPRSLWSYQQIILEKQELDVFSNPNTDHLLDQLGPVDEIVLYGVVTEICVEHAARGLIRRGYRLRLVTDAIRHLDETKAQMLVDEIGEAGGLLVTTDEIIATLSRRAA
jgi:nicotinamidase/pyrazinamidase